jgi:hypothetical protein
MTRLQRLGINRWSLLAVVGVGALVALMMMPILSPNHKNMVTSFVMFGGLATVALTLLMMLATLGFQRLRRGPLSTLQRACVFVSCCGLVWMLALPILAFALLPVRLPAGSHDLRFEAAAWQTESAWIESEVSEPTIRQKMIGDVTRRLLANKTRAEIVDVLGDPDQPDGPRAIVYYLGDCRDCYFPGIDIEFLIIHFDDEDVVSRWEVRSS